MSLSNIFSTITSSLPTIKISKWDVMVLKEQAPKRQSDGFIDNIINGVKDFTHSIQDAVSSIFQGDNKNYETIADFDSFISFNGTRQSDVVQNAIEKGSFRSVNKIAKPNICVIELGKGGYRSGIEAVLNNLKEIEGSLSICRVVTPFGIMENMNLIKLDYSYTTATGGNMLIAKMTFQEIKTGTIKETYTKKITKSPANTDTVNGGRQAGVKR